MYKVERFIEQVPQFSHVGVYYPGNDNCTRCNNETIVARCSGCDWHFDSVTCGNCPSQPACSVLDTSVCPKLGSEITASWSMSDFGTCRKNDSQNPLVDCQYNASTFDYSDILKYKEVFPEGDNFTEVIMPNFCFQSTDICPVKPGTNTPWSSCPNILSNLDGSETGNPGSECTKWSNKNPDLANASIRSFCTNSSNPVCDCINRTNSAVYNYINSNLSGSPSGDSWYIPCSNPQAFLVPSNLIRSASTSTQTCSKINQIINTVPTNLTKGQLQNEINCNITAIPSNSSTSFNTSSTPNTSNTSFVSTDSTDSSTFWLILLVVVIILIIIIAISLFFLYRPNPSVEVASYL